MSLTLWLILEKELTRYMQVNILPWTEVFRQCFRIPPLFVTQGRLLFTDLRVTRPLWTVVIGSHQWAPVAGLSGEAGS